MKSNYSQNFHAILLLICLSLLPAKMLSEEFTNGINKFSIDFHNHVRSISSGSSGSISSPLSAHTVLSLLALGSSGQTHNELVESLHMPVDKIKSSYQNISPALESVEGVTLKIANKIYIKSGNYTLKTEFNNDAKNSFNTEVGAINFADSQKSADAINAWVSAKTNDRIKKLFDAGSFDAYTRLVLVNAIYFKGNWLKQFDPKLTHDQDFHLNANNKIKVPMMHIKDRFNYGESSELNAQVLEMPYINKDVSMLFILPNDIEGLPAVMQKLSQDPSLLDIKLSSVKVQVAIPKYKIETEIDLTVLLPKLGISKIFDDRGELSGLLDGPESLSVSRAIQKAFIEVNEEGAEAAAATGMVMMTRCMMAPDPSFIANRPFFFILQSNNLHLFHGVYTGKLSI